MTGGVGRALRAALGQLLLVVAAVPVVYLIVRASQLGAETARDVWLDAATWAAAARTLGLAGGVALSSVVLALPLGWLTHATDLPGRRVFRVLLNLPLAVPSYVSGFVVVSLLAPGGWMANLLGPARTALPDVYGVFGAYLALLFTFPFALISVQAALHRVDPRLWESARSLGASPQRAFWTVVFPEVRPALASGGVLVALYAIGDFGAVSLLRVKTLSYLIYVRYKSLFDRDEAIHLSLLLVGVAVLAVIALLRLGGHARRAATTLGARRSWPVVRLGRWRWPAFGLCAAVTTAGVLVPAAVVLYWLYRGIGRGTLRAFPLREIWQTLGVGLAAGVLIVALAAAPILLRRVLDRRSGGWTRVAAHLGYALPGIVVALALVSLATTWFQAVYQTLALLLFAYAVRFLPLAVHSVDDGLSAQSARIFEASRCLGCGPVEGLVRAVLPAARPALAAAFVAVFIAVVKELPVTLLLSPIGFGTLATRIWSLTEEAYFAAAAGPVLLLLIIAGVGLIARPPAHVRDEVVP